MLIDDEGGYGIVVVFMLVGWCNGIVIYGVVFDVMLIVLCVDWLGICVIESIIDDDLGCKFLIDVI